MTIVNLDLLVKYFYNNRTEMNGTFFDDIFIDFNKIVTISKKEMLILLYKLVDDKFVSRKSIEKKVTNLGTGELIEKKYLPGFLISFDGILFFENVAIDYLDRPYQYAKEINRIKERNLIIESWPKRNWWVLPILAWILGVFTITIGKYIEQKTSPKSNLSLPTTPTLIDIDRSHKMDSEHAPLPRHK